MAREKSQKIFKLPFKLPFLRDNGKAGAALPKKNMPHFKMVIFIVDWNKSNIIKTVCEEEHVLYYFISKGVGTASSDMLDVLGIGASDKAVIICVEQEAQIDILYREARRKMAFHSPGAGIAFTIPLSGINTPMLSVLMKNIEKNEKLTIERGGANMTADKKASKQIDIDNDLIIAVVNHGYIDDLMTAARNAGATGGTVMNARGLASNGPVKFLGVSVQNEKEIVLILTSREKKLPIMEAVSLSFGMTSEAEGLIFSLPVDSIMGLNLE